MGTTVKLTTVGAPVPRVTETAVTRADAPEVLEYNWGDFDMRRELEALGRGSAFSFGFFADLSSTFLSKAFH